MKKRILVWPANTEIGLEIGHAFKAQTHFEVTGASSGPGPADFVFDVHSTTAPNVNDPNAAKWLADFCKLMLIDFVYPAHDQAAVVCADAGVPYIGSPPEAVRMCRSKRATYEAVNEKLANIVPTPYPFCPFDGERAYMKPDVGQSGAGHFIVNTKEQRDLAGYAYVATNILPGPEYTIDCLTDRHGVLRFVGARKRNRISHGICVESEKSELDFRPQAQAISDTFKMRGAWFFQMKEDKNGVPTLLEIGVRPAGSSGFHRAIGVNLPILAAYDACGLDIDVMPGKYTVSAFRSLTTHFTTDLDFDTVYCDVDDTLFVGGEICPKMLAVLVLLFNEGKSIKFLTRGHGGGMYDSRVLNAGRLVGANIDLVPKGGKSEFIEHKRAIFIDDSHAERKEVHDATGIPVFSPQQAIDLWLK
jgi:hypothetical protein